MIERFAAKIEKFVLSHRLLLLILLVTFLVRLPSLFEPLWYGDEAIYLTIGQKIVGGGLMYLEIFDHKTPGIYYLAAAVIKTLGESIWSFRFFLMVWVLATTVIFYITAKEMFSKRVAVAAVVVLSVLISTPLIEGNITNSEILMILPTMVGILFGLRKRYFLAGVFFSLSFLLKFTGIFDFGAFFIFAALAVKRHEIKATIKRLVALTLGWFLPLFITIVFFAINGGLSAYFDSAFLYNVSYTAYENSFLFSNGVLVLKALPAILVLGYFVFRSFNRFKEKGETGFGLFEYIVLWLIFSFYASVFGGRPYEHYLIQIVPAFSLLAAFIFFNKPFRKIGSFLLVGVVLLALVLGFRPFIRSSYYSDFFSYTFGRISFEQYSYGFNTQTPINYALASFITGCEEYKNGDCVKKRSSTGEKLFVFANEPAIYFLAGADPATKYITFFHIAGSDRAKSESLRDIRTAGPKFILVQNPQVGNFSGLEKTLGSSYNLFGFYENFAIYTIAEPSEI